MHFWNSEVNFKDSEKYYSPLSNFLEFQANLQVSVKPNNVLPLKHLVRLLLPHEDDGFVTI